MANTTQQTQKADDLDVSDALGIKGSYGNRLRPDKHSAISADSNRLIRSQWISENLHNNTW